MQFLLIFPVVLPLLAGLVLGICHPFQERAHRNLFTMVSLILSLVASWAVVLFVPDGKFVIGTLTPTLELSFGLDGVARLFGALFPFVWAFVGLYSFEYMEHEKNENRFYTFYLLTLASMQGIAFSGNIITHYVMYEAMTLLALPLIMHNMTKEAVAAGIKYLFYSVFGAYTALMGIFFLYNYGTTLDFVPGGVLDMAKVSGHEGLLMVIFFLTILGFGTKAGMFPMHGWLPTAHPVAPAPASAVLSGIITKAGVIGIIRVVFYLVGVDFLRGTWVQYAFMALTIVTVFMGSLLAYKEKVLKKRLAYSSVSQVSYVLFGISTMSPLGLVGALLHVVFHALIKNNLFMSAGAIIHKTGKTEVKDMEGIGKQMPRTMWCYTIASLGLIGIPPTCGFISKWYLAQGSLSLLEGFNWVGPAVLLVSAFLTAGYLLPLTIHGFFPGEKYDYEHAVSLEPTWQMLLPLVLFTVLIVLLGIFSQPLTAYLTTLAQTLM